MTAAERMKDPAVLRDEIAICERDLQLLRRQLREAEGAKGGRSANADTGRGRVLAYIRSAGTATPKEISGASGASMPSVNNAIQLLLAAKEIRRVGHGVYEVIPDAGLTNT